MRVPKGPPRKERRRATSFPLTALARRALRAAKYDPAPDIIFILLNGKLQRFTLRTMAVYVPDKPDDRLFTPKATE